LFVRLYRAINSCRKAGPSYAHQQMPAINLRRLKHPRLLAGAILLLIAILVAWTVLPGPATDAAPLEATVKQGEFRVTVTTTGELRAKNSVQIQGPSNAQQAQQFQMKISSLVPEGTVVKAGDVVAELDRSGLASRMTEVSLALQKAQAQYAQAQLDSTLALAQAREEIRTLEYALEERRIAKEQAEYEAPSIKRQAQIDLEKAQRTLEQAKKNYVTKTKQSIAKMSEVEADVERQRNQLAIVQSVMDAYTIKAPASGMVIYAKEWNGRKRQVGSQVTPWEPTVATLPDLTEMESVTYVNEIDVRKISAGQRVSLSLDADPSRHLTGTITSVANVGEQRPNADAKVFEVIVAVSGADTTLLPGMTTSNAIAISVIPDALSIPLEAMSVVDSMPIVYVKSGGQIVRREIQTGAMSENEIVIERGLSAGDQILLTAPQNASELPLEKLDPPAKSPPDAIPGDTARPALRTSSSGSPEN
jgi:RND family efflux transporter MFP subunit